LSWLLTEPTGPQRHVVLAFIISQAPDKLLDSDVLLSEGCAAAMTIHLPNIQKHPNLL